MEQTTLSLEERLLQYPVKTTENQHKVIKEKYLRDDLNIQTWLLRIAKNIALSELLYHPEFRQKILGNLSYESTQIDAGDGKSEILLLHTKTSNYDEKTKNHKQFISNLYSIVESDPRAKEIVDKYTEEFFYLMSDWEFLPNSPTLMNAGRELQQLSACYVLPVEDSVEGWGKAVSDALSIHKSGGGTGFSGARIRPRGDAVKSTKGIASGPLSVLRMVNANTQEIKQGGTRRGANMFILPASHPDINDFIKCKGDLDEKSAEIYNVFKQMTGLNEEFPSDKQILDNFKQALFSRQFENFNISVATDTKFWEVVKAGTDYELLHPKTKNVFGKINAKKLLDMISQYAWLTGDPGIVMTDRINESFSNPTPDLGQVEATNPCGEQPLLPNEPCNLGSINLSKFYENGKVNYERISDTVKKVVRFLDDVIDVNNYPTKEIELMAKNNRRIGLGVMGFGDLLALMKIPYDSEEGVKFGEQLMSFIQKESVKASEELAKERGLFPAFNNSIFDKNGKNYREWSQNRRPRNAAITTIAPTGTIGIAAGCYGQGIEPFFGLGYIRRDAKAIDAQRQGKEASEQNVFYFINSIFDEVAKENNYFGLGRDNLIKRIEENNGSIRGIKEIPEGIQNIFTTAHDISSEYHVKHQAAFQKYTDNAVSKTINLPENATVDDIKRSYMLAYELGCKGITVYRDKSKSDQVITLSGHSKKDPVIEEIASLRKVIGYKEKERTKAIPGITFKQKAGSNFNAYQTLTYEGGELFELFSAINVVNDPDLLQANNVTSVNISMRIRNRESIDAIVETHKGAQTSKGGFDRGYSIASIYDAMAATLELRGFRLTEDDKKLLSSKFKYVELIMLRAQERYLREKGALPQIQIAQETPSKSSNVEDGEYNGLGKKPCPGCGETIYNEKRESGCIYNTCCYYSPTCS